MTLRIHDPYAVPGEYRKVQLHCHTTESDGRFRPVELLRMYKQAGYAAVFITDHNRVTRCDEQNDETFLALPGTEDTVSRIRPLGPHMLRLFVDESLAGGDAQRLIRRTAAAGGLTGLCHPSWTGNLRTGSWSETAITTLRGYDLIEICNPHTDPARDVARWESALRRGTEPVWGVAVDDCHGRTQFNRGWIMAKVGAISPGDLREALHRGAFYATTGPEARFAVDGEAVAARFDEPLTIRFVDAQGRLRHEQRGTEAGYRLRGDEQYLRVEGRRGPSMVWSQPFTVTAGSAPSGPGGARA